ncbi:hypothetical protein HT031_006003 [Scenedesmus sp. PABB004]|nr:hypothetical protein HT031_006003 [Scenedesmus sp. PABB004]
MLLQRPAPTRGAAAAAAAGPPRAPAAGWRCRCSRALVSAVATAAAAADAGAASRVRLRTGAGCALAVARYPRFAYDASSGGGAGSVTQLGGGRVALAFDAAGLAIPALSWRTASVLGLPLPPPLEIAIRPRKLEGELDTATGRLDLVFDAEFCFRVGAVYTAPPLQVTTTLTTEASSGEIHAATGARLAGGRARLVGVSRVPRVEGGDWFLNLFLQLPTDALAELDAELEFS